MYTSGCIFSDQEINYVEKTCSEGTLNSYEISDYSKLLWLIIIPLSQLISDTRFGGNNDYSFFISNSGMTSKVPEEVIIGVCQLKPEYYNSAEYSPDMEVKPKNGETPCMNDFLTAYTSRLFLSGCFFVEDGSDDWSSKGCEVYVLPF